MAAAEANSRRNRKPGPAADRLARAAGLRELEKNLGIKIKRHKDPGNVTNRSPFQKNGESLGNDKDESTIVMRGF